MSNSCLLRFLCQNLFQGAIFCSLKQLSICISIQRVTVRNGLSQCFMELSVNSLAVFETQHPILPLPSHLGHLPSPKTSQNENGLRLINYRDQHATTIHSLENHPSEQFFHLWTGGLSNRFNAKNLHISIVPCFCISVLQFTLHERSHNETIQKSSCL